MTDKTVQDTYALLLDMLYTPNMLSIEQSLAVNEILGQIKKSPAISDEFISKLYQDVGLA